MTRALPNGIMVIENDAWISAWVEETGRLDHDQWLLERVLPFVPKGGVVVDAGAFIGDHTIAYVEAVGPDGTVLAFEPNPEAFRCLQNNVPQARCFRTALSDVRGNEPLVVQEGNPGATHIGAEGAPARLMPLDDLNLQHLSYMKIDVEGHEPRVIQGASATLRRCRPVLLVEMNDGALERAGSTQAALQTLIVAHGYRIRPIDPAHHFGMPMWECLCEPV